MVDVGRVWPTRDADGRLACIAFMDAAHALRHHDSMAVFTPPRGMGRLHSGAPFWLVKNGIRDEGTPLASDAVTDVAIVGAGLTGAFLADALTACGLDVAVLDRNEPGAGSTGASTALVMYDLDVGLVDLMATIGEDDATRVYRSSQRAVGTLAHTALALGGCGFEARDSLYLASTAGAVASLEHEATVRRRLGFPASFLDRQEVATRFGIEAQHGALVSGQAAQLDPIRLTHALLQRATRRGASIASQTEVAGVTATRRGVVVHTTRGVDLRARQVVFATGYEVPPELPKDLVRLRCTYALASERSETVPAWLDRALLWETKRPYLYLRASGDGRLLAGGEDLPFKGAALRDRLLPSRIERLERAVDRVLPDLRLRTAFAWAGTFAETIDCLPIIGRHPRHERVFVALGYGGNGMTFSALAARLIADALIGRPDADGRLFAPDRSTRPHAPRDRSNGATDRATRTTGVSS